MLLAASPLSRPLRLGLLVQSWERGDPLRPPRRQTRLLAGAVWFLENGEGVKGKKRALLNVLKLKAKLHVHILVLWKFLKETYKNFFLQRGLGKKLMKDKVVVKGILEKSRFYLKETTNVNI